MIRNDKIRNACYPYPTPSWLGIGNHWHQGPLGAAISQGHSTKAAPLAVGNLATAQKISLGRGGQW